MAAQRRGDAASPERDGRRGGLIPLLRAAGRRFALLLALASGVTVVGSLLLGLLAGASAARAISLGFYLVGSFLVVAGFFVGNRGPVRPRGEERGGFLFIPPTRRRWATAQEHDETINDSAILVVLGLVLIFLGVLADNRYELI